MSGPDPGPQTPTSRSPAAPADTASGRAAGGATPDTGVEPYLPKTGDDLPEVFGRYRIIRKLGVGGMGVVYLAHDTLLDGPVALKVPLVECMQNPAAVERFYREARAAFALRQVPGVCQVRDVGEFEGRHYLAMDFVGGRPLTAVARNLSIPEAVDLVRRLALTLHAAHEQGIVHRDLKPANVILDESGAPIVMDFGLARRDGANEPRLTQSGAVLGTPVYMPPEQIKGVWNEIGPRSDVYSLGVMLYEMLTGALPFGGSVYQILGQILAVDPVLPSQLNAAVDGELTAICLKAMAKSPHDRFSSMLDFAGALESWLSGRAAAVVRSTMPVARRESGAGRKRTSSRSARSGAQARRAAGRRLAVPRGASDSRTIASRRAKRAGPAGDGQRRRIPTRRQTIGLTIGFAVTVAFSSIWLVAVNAPQQTAKEDRGSAPSFLLELLPIAEQEVDEEQELRLQVPVRARLPEGVSPEFSLAPDAPTGCRIDSSTGVMTWTPNENEGPGSYVATVRVRVPGRNELFDERPLAIAVREVNRVPVLAPLTDQKLSVGETLQFRVTATDPDHPQNALRYSLGWDAPSNAEIDGNTGLLAWKPDASVRAGAYNIPVRVTDYGDPPRSVGGTLRVIVEYGRKIQNSIGMTLVGIEPGEFLMGSPDTEEGRGNDEKQHRVRITRPFYLGAHEVTVGQFRRFVDAAKYETEAERDGKGGWGWNETEGKFEGRKPEYNWRNTGWAQTDAHPVVNVTWNDAVAFCNWLSRQEELPEHYRIQGDTVTKVGGPGYRLPTEAEWEHACRAGTTTRYWHGDDPEGLAQVGNVADATAKAKLWNYQSGTYISARDGYVFTAPVGSFRPNAWGLFDVHGNVWEWCEDWFDIGYYANSPVEDPPGPPRGSGRVFRGGGWGSSPQFARSALRGWGAPGYRPYGLGFRLARSPSGQPR